MDQSNTVPIKRTLSLRAEPSTTLAAASSTTLVAADSVPLRQLTAGRNALKIAHDGETYVLQITRANKLILTKPKL
jgi:hemin uptake protein HemP